MESKKIVDIGEDRYQINLMDAIDGSWAMGLVLSAMSDAIMSAMVKAEGLPGRRAETKEDEEDAAPDSPEVQTTKAVRFALMSLGRDETRKLYHVCLGAVSKIENVNGREHATSIIMESGEYAVPELRYDLVTVMRLVATTLIFNLTPFFRAGGLGKILALAASNQ